jgi:hypothetical protein
MPSNSSSVTKGFSASTIEATTADSMMSTRWRSCSF